MLPERSGSHDPDEETVPRQEYERYASASDPSVSEDPDVVLDVPVLNVEELDLEVKSLKIQVAVQAELADMVKLNVGVTATLGEVKLSAKGVEAQALLKAKLENIRAILEQAIGSIDKDPSIIERLAGGADQTTGGAENGVRRRGTGDAAGDAREADRTVRRTADESGNVSKTVFDESGAVVEEDASEGLADLPLEEEYADDEGRTVGRVTDDAGNVIEEELDEKGNVVRMLNFVGADGLVVRGGATEAAVRKARELGLDLSAVSGTGSRGRILVKDVEEAAKNDQ